MGIDHDGGGGSNPYNLEVGWGDDASSDFPTTTVIVEAAVVGRAGSDDRVQPGDDRQRTKTISRQHGGITACSNNDSMGGSEVIKNAERPHGDKEKDDYG